MGIFDIFKKKGSTCGICLHGRWILVQADGDLDIGDGVEMEFQPNGGLTYSINAGDKVQIMKLTYRVEGNQIISNQPSAPNEEKTTFRFEGEQLVLESDGSRSWFKRPTE